MPFINKEIKITDFLEKLHERLRLKDDSDALIFFEIFLKKDLVKDFMEQNRIASNWDGRINAGNFDVIYPFAARMLHDAAARNVTDSLSIYETANTVSVTFWEELNELFECSEEHKFDLIPIKSYVEMAAAAGIIKVEDGKVKLTDEAKDAAESMEKEIKGGLN